MSDHSYSCLHDSIIQVSDFVALILNSLNCTAISQQEGCWIPCMLIMDSKLAVGVTVTFSLSVFFR